MKNRILKPFVSAVCAAFLCVSLTVPAFAAQNPFAAMEAGSQRAVEAAVKAGTIPAGTTIYDCEYAADKNGVTVVIRYKDKSGNWIDVITGKKAATPESPQPQAVQKLSEDALAEYAAEVFKLTNEAREQAGLSPLSRDSELDGAAAIRAEELSRKFSHERPDGTRFYTVMGVEVNYNYAENGGASASTPKNQMQNWLNSDGHRANILDLNGKGYTKIGIGVYQASDGSLYYCQLFYRPI